MSGSLKNFHLDLLVMGTGCRFDDVADRLNSATATTKNLTLIPRRKTNPEPDPLAAQGMFRIHHQDIGVLKERRDQELDQFRVIGTSWRRAGHQTPGPF